MFDSKRALKTNDHAYVTALKFFSEEVQLKKYENGYSLQKTWKKSSGNPYWCYKLAY